MLAQVDLNSEAPAHHAQMVVWHDVPMQGNSDAGPRIAEQMTRRGWNVQDIESVGVDVRIRGQLDGRGIRLLALSPFSATVANAAADPSFFRLEIGDVGDEVAHWGAWKNPSFIATGNASTYGGLQCFKSESALAVAGGYGNPQGMLGFGVVEQFFSQVDKVTTNSRRGKNRSKANLEPARGLDAWPSGTALWLRRAASLGRLFASETQRRTIASMLGEAAGLAQALRGTLGLALQGAPVVLHIDILPVVCAAGSNRESAHAEVVHVGFRASNVRDRLELRLRRSTVVWPVGVLDPCRLVPSVWTTMELQGPAPLLQDVPPHPRLQRSESAVRWLLDSQESDTASVLETFASLARQLRKSQGPYR